MRAASGFLLWILSFGALSCTILPAHLNDRPADLVDSTPAIVLARAVSFTDPDGGSLATFTFEAVRTLKGNPPKSFRLDGYHAKKVGSPGDFQQHKDPKFWAFEAGNSIQPGNCQAHGLFEVGQTYLIFLRRDSHYRAYENIRSPEDLWLKVVETLIHRGQHTR